MAVLTVALGILQIIIESFRGIFLSVKRTISEVPYLSYYLLNVFSGGYFTSTFMSKNS